MKGNSSGRGLAETELTYELVQMADLGGDFVWGGVESTSGASVVGAGCGLRGGSLCTASACDVRAIGVCGTTETVDFTTGSMRGGEIPLDPGGSPRLLAAPYAKRWCCWGVVHQTSGRSGDVGKSHG